MIIWGWVGGIHNMKELSKGCEMIYQTRDLEKGRKVCVCREGGWDKPLMVRGGKGRK